MHGLPARTFGPILLAASLLTGNLSADPVSVRHPQGSSHGFLIVKTLEGTRIATGDATQIVNGDHVTSRVTFRFSDGSIDDDTTVFSQRGVFRLISDHHTTRTLVPETHRCLHKRVHRADYVSYGGGKIETRSSRSPTRRLEWPSAQSPDERPSLGA